jgi:hypothetical protein
MQPQSHPAEKLNHYKQGFFIPFARNMPAGARATKKNPAIVMPPSSNPQNLPYSL